MKQHYKLPNARRLFHGIKLTIFYSCITLLLYGCFLKQDRTTTVYGTITDENGLAVDSILVILRGMQNLTGERLAQVYTDKKGDYEFVMEVPKKFVALDLAIPFWVKENPKYQKTYKGFTVDENGKPTNNCCIAEVGQKTKYDFQLIPK